MWPSRLFKDDAFSSSGVIVVDLMIAHGDVLVPILAHEFHHSFVNRLSSFVPSAGAEGKSLADLLYTMRNEGIADLIDKPYPFKPFMASFADYAERYNAEYARTPIVLGQSSTPYSVSSPTTRAKGRQ